MSLIERFVESPRDFPENELDALAGEVRRRIIEVVSANGGHLASSLGAVEICIALLRVFDPLRDRIVWDVGHQAYAWKILTGRNASFGTLRRLGGISGFPRMVESKADAFGAGHAGVAISAALGISAAQGVRDPSMGSRQVGQPAPEDDGRTEHGDGRAAHGDGGAAHGAGRAAHGAARTEHGDGRAALGQRGSGGEEPPASPPASPPAPPLTTIAVTGDASISNGISLEALNNIDAARGPFIILLNDNRMAISRNVGSLSRHFGYLLSSRRYNKVKTGIESFGKKLRLHGLSDFYHRCESGIKRLFVHSGFFENLGLRYMGPLDGHNIVRLSHALEIARDYGRPIVIHAATQKGRGYGPAEADPSAWHGVGPFDAAGGTPRGRRVRDYSAAFGEALCAEARGDRRVVAITAAMPGGTGLAGFAGEFPGRFFDVGICEEHAVSFAAGLAAGGARPFAAIYSTFAQRAIDSFAHDVCLQNLPVTLCLDRAGAVGADGATHHGLYDIPMLRALPNLAIAQPRDAVAMKALLALSLASSHPFVIRYPRGRCEDDIAGSGTAHMEEGMAEILKHPCEDAGIALGRVADGGGEPMSTQRRAVWIWALGDMIPIALEAANFLEARLGVRAGVVDPVFVKPIDRDLLRSQADSGAVVATIENGILQGGFGSAVQEAIPGAAVMRFGWGDEPLPHGSIEELMAGAGLTAEAVANAIAGGVAP